MKNKPNHKFVNETLFFPEKGILVIGDLHIGFEHMLQQSGVLIPERQVADIIEDLNNIINKIKSKNQSLKKIIFIGDIKHIFSYEWKEKSNFKKILEFLKKHVAEDKIIFIKGNHDTMNLGLNFKDYHIEGDVFFTHGHKSFPEMFDEKIKIIVAGHLHPAVVLSDDSGVKKEAYKCFLEGEYKGKTFIVLPSFLGFVEGTLVNEYEEDYVESFFIVPKKAIMKFKIRAVGEDGVYEFGKIEDL